MPHPPPTATAPGSDDSRSRRRRDSARAPLFVGRRRELDELASALDEARAGRGCLFLLSGESGIGKTRLAEELAGRAGERGARALWGRSREGVFAPPYWPWVQVIRAALRGLDVSPLASSLGPGGSRLAELVPELRAHTPPPALGTASVDSEHARFHLFDAAAALLREIAVAAPIVVALEDLHWADHPSLLLLGFIARELSDAPVLIVGTYRDDEVRASPETEKLLADVARHGHSLPLRGLARVEVGHLIEGVGPATDAMVSAVHAATGGNPFFVGEVARLLAAEGKLGAPGVAKLADLGIPDGVRGSIRRRLGFLPEEGAHLLALASIIGREFDLAWLEPLSRLPADRLFDLLERAEALGLVLPAGQIGRYAFSHALMRETLYDSLGAPERMRAHRELGEVIERLHAEDLEPHVDTLAHHFREASAAGGRTQARDYALRAARRAMRLLAYEDAIGHFERVRSILGPLALGGAERCDILLDLGEAYNNVGENPRASAVLEEAAAIAAGLGDGKRLGRAALGYDRGLVETGFLGANTATAIRLLEHAASLAGDENAVLHSRLLARIALARLYSREIDEAMHASREAEDLARRAGDRAALLNALGARYAVSFAPEKLDDRLAVAGELARLSCDPEDPDVVLAAYNLHVDSFLEVGDLASAEREIERYLLQATRQRLPLYRSYAILSRAVLAIAFGRFAEAERFIAEATSVHLAFHETVAGSVLVDAVRWFLDLHVGRVQALREISEKIVAQDVSEIAREVTLCGLALIYAELGLESAARGVLERFGAPSFEGLPGTFSFLTEAAILAEACYLLADAPGAARLYDLMLPYAARNVVRCGPVPYLWGPVSHYLGLLATTLRRWEDAEKHFGAALEMGARMGAAPSVARAEHRLAEMLLARAEPGDRERAVDLLASAEGRAEALGMKALRKRIVALRHAPSPVSRSAAAFWKEGDYWTVTYEGKTVRLKAINGFDHLAELLRAPGTEIHALELARGAGGDASRPSEGLEVLDAQARVAYRRRLAELEQELEEARRLNDLGRVARYQAESEALTDQLAAALGLGGRERKVGSTAERARQAGTKAVRKALDRISSAHPALGRHLEESIRTGAFFSYRPRSRVDWRL